MRALARDTELLGDVGDRATVLNHARDEQTTTMHIQASVSVGHEDLLVREDLDISTKPGGPHLSQDPRRHQRLCRVHLGLAGLPDVRAERPLVALGIAQITREVNSTDYGSTEFGLRDPEGNQWSFGTYVGEPRKA